MDKPYTISDKYESSCHGAPVKVLKRRLESGIKYCCFECNDPCIPRQKKGDVMWSEL